MAEKYRIEGDTLIVNDGVTTIEKTDFHTYNGNGTSLTEYENLKDEKFQYVKKLVLPDSVTEIGKFAFFDFPSLEDVTLPNGITNISSYAFWNCTSLKSVTIPDGVKSIGSKAFQDCTSLTDITIPNNVEEIGNFAFGGCTNLKSVTIPDSVTNIDEDAFRNCKRFEIICQKGSYAEEFAAEKGILIEYIDEEKYRIEGDTLIINDGVTTIDKDDFHFCDEKEFSFLIKHKLENIKKVIIPDSVTSIEHFSFYNYENLESITIPDNVEVIGGLAFNGCESLTSITIPSSVKSIGRGAFRETKWLENQQKKNPLVVVNGILIDGCECSGKVTIPSSVKSIGDGAFVCCENLESITIPDSVTNIGKKAFDYCENLKSITIPNSVTSIEDSTFFNCENLKSITIPDSVTSIADNAFDECENLTITCYKGSYVEKYAKENDIPVEYIDEHTKEQALSQIKDTILENGAGTLTLNDFGDKHYNVQIESDSEIYTFKVSLPVSKTVGGVKVQGFKKLGYIDTGKDEVGKTLKEIAENTAVVTSRKNGSKSLNEIFKDNKGKTLD